MFSKKVLQIGQSPIREFSPICAKKREQGIKVYPLNIGQPDIKTPKEYFKAVSSFNESVLKYTNSQGIPELLNAFKNYYKRININLDTKDILITNGGSEAILFAFLTLCDDKDEIIVFEPYYTNYNIFATQAGIKLTAVTTHPEENFRIPDEKEIEAKINDKTRAFCITNPSNPTGRVYTKEEIRTICDIAKKHDLFLIVDEVYREFVYDGEFLSFASIKDVEDRVIIIDSMSKRFSACGSRIGCLISKNEEFMAHALKFAQARLCAPYIDQVASTAVLNKTSDKYLKDTIKEYKKRRDTLYEGLNSIEGISFKKPAGAFYMVVKLPVESAYDFAKWLLEEYSYKNQTVTLCPASEFYATKELGVDEVRIAYILKEEDLINAVEVLSHGLKEYLKITNQELVKEKQTTKKVLNVTNTVHVGAY